MEWSVFAKFWEAMGKPISCLLSLAPSTMPGPVQSLLIYQMSTTVQTKGAAFGKPQSPATHLMAFWFLSQRVHYQQKILGKVRVLHRRPSKSFLSGLLFFKPQVFLAEVGLCGPNERQIKAPQEPPSQELNILFSVSSPCTHAIEAARTMPSGSL